MKIPHAPGRRLFLGLLALIAGFPLRGFAAEHPLMIEILPRFGDKRLLFDSLTNRIETGRNLSVTRLDFLLSRIDLRRADGTWLGRSNQFAFVHGREGRTAFTLAGIPSGHYDRMRFGV